MRTTHKNLVEALRLLKTFAGKPPSKLPIFTVAELRVAGGKALLRRRCGEAEIAVELDAAVPLSTLPHTLVVPVDAMIKALKAVKPDAAGGVEIGAVPDKPHQLRVGPLTLDAPVNPEDLPAPHPASAVTDDQSGAFLDELSRVAPAMCTDVTREALNGVWFDGAILATDGHRLHLREPFGMPYVEHEGCTKDDAASCPQPLPTAVVEALLAIKRPHGLRLGFRHFMQPPVERRKASHAVDGVCMCTSGTALLVTLRWREGETMRPNWREVSPQGAPNARLTLAVPDLREHLALLRAHLGDSKKMPAVTFTLNKGGPTTLEAESYEAVKLVRELAPTECAMTIEESVATVACNSSYLLDALDTLGADAINIDLHFSHDSRDGKLEHMSPLVVSGVDNSARRVLVMPCRV